MFRKQQGLPQLLGLGGMFILAATFFVVQLWLSVNSPLDAATALQPPPVMPPAYQINTQPSPESDSSSLEVVDLEAEAVEVAEIESNTEIETKKNSEIEVIEAPVEVIADGRAAKLAVAKSAVAKSADDKKQAVAKVDSAPNLKVCVGEETPQESIQNENHEQVGANVAKSAGLVKADSKLAAFVEAPPIEAEPRLATTVKIPVQVAKGLEPVSTDSTQIPPEWNWFSNPLKIEVSEGRVAIVADNSGEQIKIAADEKVVLSSAASSEEVTLSQPAEREQPGLARVEPVIEVVAASQTPVLESQSEPFQEAVVKLHKVRTDRIRRDQSRGYPDKSVELLAVHSSMSMTRVRSYLAYMKTASAYERALVSEFNPFKQVDDAGLPLTIAEPADNHVMVVPGVRPYMAENNSVKASRLHK